MDSMQYQSKIPESYFMNTDKLILKFIQRGKTQSSQHNIEGEEQRQRTDVTRLQDLL